MFDPFNLLWSEIPEEALLASVLLDEEGEPCCPKCSRRLVRLEDGSYYCEACRVRYADG